MSIALAKKKFVPDNITATYITPENLEDPALSRAVYDLAFLQAREMNDGEDVIADKEGHHPEFIKRVSASLRWDKNQEIILLTVPGEKAGALLYLTHTFVEVGGKTCAALQIEDRVVHEELRGCYLGYFARAAAVSHARKQGLNALTSEVANVHIPEVVQAKHKIVPRREMPYRLNNDKVQKLLADHRRFSHDAGFRIVKSSLSVFKRATGRNGGPDRFGRYILEYRKNGTLLGSCKVSRRISIMRMCGYKGEGHNGLQIEGLKCLGGSPAENLQLSRMMVAKAVESGSNISFVDIAVDASLDRSGRTLIENLGLKPNFYGANDQNIERLFFIEKEPFHRLANTGMQLNWN